MNKENFDEIVYLIKDDLERKKNHRHPITPLEKLAIALRYLATGNSQISLAMSFRVSPQSVSIIILDVLEAICKRMGPIFLPPPTTETWKKYEEGYRKIWNFPNACGALDGKHIKIQCPKFSGSTYFNYKHFFSVVLLAIADTWYKFTCVDIGASGSQSDGGVFSRSSIGSAMDKGQLGLPSPKAIGSGTSAIPHVILADDAFSLKPNIMKPYPGKLLSKESRIYNYRMSRARMTVENSFGILAARFRIFHTTILAEMNLTKLIVQAAVILHNFLISKKDLNSITTDSPSEGAAGNWRDIVAHDNGSARLAQQGSNTFSVQASDVRNAFRTFFNGEGAVPWQANRIL